jgi:hypothetical protein
MPSEKTDRCFEISLVKAQQQYPFHEIVHTPLLWQRWHPLPWQAQPKRYYYLVMVKMVSFQVLDVDTYFTTHQSEIQ